MTPIADIQAQLRELGRIRLGATEETGGVYESGPMKGKKKVRPTKLGTFRLTSQIRPLIEQAADIYGGEAREWDNDGRPEWEVLTDTDTIPVVIATANKRWFEQWYELWKGGGLERRCDGINQDAAAGPCKCPSDPEQRQALAAKGQACKATTRVSFLLPDLPDLGTWRLESHGYWAAVELGGAKTLIDLAAGHDNFIPADLRLIHREGARRPGHPTKTFYVPAISFRHNLGLILDSVGALEAPPVGAGAGPQELLPASAGPAPALQALIEDLYDDAKARANALSPEDRTDLLAYCNTENIDILAKIENLPQDQVRKVSDWLSNQPDRGRWP